jgi:putative hydrolase of HD superfamily
MDLHDPLGGVLTFLEAAGHLKGLERAGWVRVGVPNPEHVADHAYRVAMLALLLAPRLGLDVGKSVQLALLHDLAEARVGDLTPADGVSPAAKRAREQAAFAAIVEGLPEGPALAGLFREYEGEATPEARAVRQLDKLEMALQALEYERETGLDLDQFWASARAALSDPLLIDLYDRAYAQRPARSRG